MSNSPRIHHVQVAMPGGEREDDARAFYGGLLGFEEIEKPASLHSLGGVWFGTGSIDLHLGIEEPFAPAKKAHVAYHISDLEVTAQALRDAGYPVTPDFRLPGYDRLYTEDPFGNRVEILKLQD